MSAAKLSESLPTIEAVAEQLHNSEMIKNKNEGRFSVKTSSGEETMVPFDQLSDGAKGAVQDRVKIVYAAIDQAAEHGAPKTRKAG